jgi:Holliday junction resolvase RusA-like endonuclease
MINFTIYGEPTAQGRPRATSRGGFIKLYDPEKSRSYKELVYSEAVQVKPDELLQCELVAVINAYFSIPKSKSKKWKEQARAEIIKPTKKPDADNVAKLILDGCNGILYKDDSQIVTLIVHKKYSDNPRVEVKIAKAV